MTAIVDVQQQLVITTAAGLVGDEDLHDARRALLNDPLFDPSFDRLWDFSAVTQARVSDAVIAELVATSPSRPQVYRAVVCVTPGPAAKVLQLIAESRALDRQIAVFPDREAAERWIWTSRAAPPLL